MSLVNGLFFPKNSVNQYQRDTLISLHNMHRVQFLNYSDINENYVKVFKKK